MNLVKRDSGIVVPADLAVLPDKSKPAGPVGAYDPDGRRRIVISDELRRQQDRLVAAMKTTGQAVFMACRADFSRADGKPACGDVMVPVGIGGPDPGYECQCTRIHFEFRTGRP
jgi:hypothetical protein